MVSEQNRALGMAATEREQIIYRTIAGQPSLVQETLDVPRGFVKREGGEVEGAGLPVKRTLAVREQGPHQGWLAAREDVGGRGGVVLDDGSNEAIQ